MKTIFDFGWVKTKSSKNHDMLEHDKKHKMIFFSEHNIIIRTYKRNYPIEICLKYEEVFALADYLKTLDTDAE